MFCCVHSIREKMNAAAEHAQDTIFKGKIGCWTFFQATKKCHTFGQMLFSCMQERRQRFFSRDTKEAEMLYISQMHFFLLASEKGQTFEQQYISCGPFWKSRDDLT